MYLHFADVPYRNAIVIHIYIYIPRGAQLALEEKQLVEFSGEEWPRGAQQSRR